MAKKFKFSLNSILGLRTNKVDEAKVSLGKVIHLKNIKLNEKEIILDEKKDLQQNWAVSGKVFFAQALINRKNHLIQEVKKTDDEIKKIEQVENMRRVTLNLAMQEEKVLLNLKDKKYEEYKQKVLKEESIIMDEIAQNSFRTKNL